MRRMGIGILIILAVAAGVSGVANYAYHLGLARGIASVAAPSTPGAAQVYPYGAYPGYPYAGPFGFGFAGLVWPIVLLVLAVALARRSMRAGGACGPRGGAPRWLDDGHRRAHESTGSAGPV
jgi:hypothetical protein